MRIEIIIDANALLILISYAKHAIAKSIDIIKAIKSYIKGL